MTITEHPEIRCILERLKSLPLTEGMHPAGLAAYEATLDAMVLRTAEIARRHAMTRLDMETRDHALELAGKMVDMIDPDICANPAEGELDAAVRMQMAAVEMIEQLMTGKRIIA